MILEKEVEKQTLALKTVNPAKQTPKKKDLNPVDPSIGKRFEAKIMAEKRLEKPVEIPKVLPRAS